MDAEVHRREAGNPEHGTCADALLHQIREERPEGDSLVRSQRQIRLPTRTHSSTSHRLVSSRRNDIRRLEWMSTNEAGGNISGGLVEVLSQMKDENFVNVCPSTKLPPSRADINQTLLLISKLLV